jgi:hypothetical protein
MVNKLIALLALIIFTGSVVGSFFFGRATTRTDIVRTEVERDTIIIHDTIREYYPRYISEVSVGKTAIKIPTLLLCRDFTQFGLPLQTEVDEKDSVTIELPITERAYKDDEYYAIVRGYDPSLKYIEVYPRTVYLTTTETITKQKRWNISFGAQMGYGFTPKGWQPYTGLGITFGINF